MTDVPTTATKRPRHESATAMTCRRGERDRGMWRSATKGRRRGTASPSAVHFCGDSRGQCRVPSVMDGGLPLRGAWGGTPTLSGAGGARPSRRLAGTSSAGAGHVCRRCRRCQRAPAGPSFPVRCLGARWGGTSARRRVRSGHAVCPRRSSCRRIKPQTGSAQSASSRRPPAAHHPASSQPPPTTGAAAAPPTVATADTSHRVGHPPPPPLLGI